MKDFWSDRILASLTVVLAVLGLATLGWVMYKNFFVSTRTEIGETSCVKESLPGRMTDGQMPGLLNVGREFKVLLNFYACNPIKRGDLVYFRFSESIEPAIRSVVGLPDDLFEVVQDTAEPRRYFVKINGQFVTVNELQYYFLSDVTPPLKTYELSRRGRLGAKEYIILTNVPNGITDSSNFGLVRANEFTGRVLPL